MKLTEYLAEDGALTVSQLRERAGIKSDAQIRQWQHGYGDRQPSPEYCVAIWRATGGKVNRWDLRPNDWFRIWPELIGAQGAPAVPTAANDTPAIINTASYVGHNRRGANGGRRSTDKQATQPA